MKKVCLIGSTRFREEYERVNQQLSQRGYVVYSVSCFGNSGDSLTTEDKLVLDAVHLRKIVESDVVFVINKGGYIGESTTRELYFSRIMGKDIRWLESNESSVRFDRVNFRSEDRPCNYI